MGVDGRRTGSMVAKVLSSGERVGVRTVVQSKFLSPFGLEKVVEDRMRVLICV